MQSDNLQVRIDHRVAQLRHAYPGITACRAVLEDWWEGTERRYSLRFDIRWPQHQSLVSGRACATPEQAIEAAFDQAVKNLGGKAFSTMELAARWSGQNRRGAGCSGTRSLSLP